MLCRCKTCSDCTFSQLSAASASQIHCSTEKLADSVLDPRWPKQLPGVLQSIHSALQKLEDTYNLPRVCYKLDILSLHRSGFVKGHAGMLISAYICPRISVFFCVRLFIEPHQAFDAGGRTDK